MLRHGVCWHIQPFVHLHYLTTAALIFLEYLLTFDQEVRLFWGKKLTGAVALFFVNRYTTIIYTIFDMLFCLVSATTATARVGLRPLLSLERHCVLTGLYWIDVRMFWKLIRASVFTCFSSKRFEHGAHSACLRCDTGHSCCRHVQSFTLVEALMLMRL